MKKKLTLLGFICLALALAAMPFAGCAKEAPAPAAPAVAPAAPAEPVYTVLDPRSYQEPWEYQGLTPRLDTLDGKSVIVVNLHGGNEEAIKSVGPALQAAVPACNVISLEAYGYGDLSKDDWDMIMGCDAVIFGHDY